MRIIMQEYPPSPALRPYIEFLWEGRFNVEAAGRLSQLVVPNGYLELIVHLTDDHCELLQGADFSPSPDHLLIGMYSQPYEVQFPRPVRVFGIRFKPEGTYPLFGLPAGELSGQTADVESVAGRRFREFCHRLREQKLVESRLALSDHFLQEQLRRREVERYYVQHAADLIRRTNGQITVDELAGNVHISRRQLEREFKQKIGLSPKRYSRIARLNEANRRLESGDVDSLTTLAYDSGYADQAHFIREFKAFTGENPTVFLREREGFIVNVKEAPAHNGE